MPLKTTPAIFSPVGIKIVSEGKTEASTAIDNENWLIRDNEQLKTVNDGIKRSSKIDGFRRAIDTTLSVAASFIAAHAGTAPSYFPILSNPSSGSIHSPKSVRILQDRIDAPSLAELLSSFISTDRKSRPDIDLVYHDRRSVLNLLGKLAGMVVVTQAFGREQREVKLEDLSSDNDEVLAFALNGNHLPNLNRYLEGDQSILIGWAATKSAKSHDSANDAGAAARKTLLSVKHKLETAESENRNFWMTLYIQILLDIAFLSDGESSEAHQALTLARQLDDPAFIAHCGRFANQTLGVSPEALALLDDSRKRFDAIPRNSEQFSIFLQSRFATMLNGNTTQFISSSSPIDPDSFEADYWEAKEVCPSYSNIGMLASAAAVGHMIKNRPRKAMDLLERAALERSSSIDGFNIRMNLLCSQHNHLGSFDEFEFTRLCEDIDDFDFAASWEYHRARIGLNLMKISQNAPLHELAWEAIQHSSFLSEYSHGKNVDALASFLIRRRYSHYTVGGKVAGQFGRFYERTGLFLCIDKDWT